MGLGGDFLWLGGDQWGLVGVSGSRWGFFWLGGDQWGSVGVSGGSVEVSGGRCGWEGMGARFSKAHRKCIYTGTDLSISLIIETSFRPCKSRFISRDSDDLLRNKTTPFLNSLNKLKLRDKESDYVRRDPTGWIPTKGSNRRGPIGGSHWMGPTGWVRPEGSHRRVPGSRVLLYRYETSFINITIHPIASVKTEKKDNIMF